MIHSDVVYEDSHKTFPFAYRSPHQLALESLYNLATLRVQFKDRLDWTAAGFMGTRIRWTMEPEALNENQKCK